MRFSKFPIIVAIVAATAIPALANIQVTKLSLTTTGWTYQSGSGGEFHAVISDMPLVGLPLGAAWETFCLEENENVSTSTASYYGVLNTAAVKGGQGGAVAGANPLYSGDLPGTDSKGQSEMGDPLDARTAYLFTQFAKGTLTSYDYSANVTAHKASAGALQQAIWTIEQEMAPTTNTQALAWIQEAEDAISGGSWSGLGNVRVLNLYGGYNAGSGVVSSLKQDILVLVPAPAAAFLGFFGLGIVGWIKRRIA